MISCKYNFNYDGCSFLEISGHANSGDYGNDLVCAAVTAIVSGALNSFDLRAKEDIELDVKENLIIIKQLNKSIKISDMMQMLIDQLDTIRLQYPNNLKMKEVL